MLAAVCPATLGFPLCRRPEALRSLFGGLFSAPTKLDTDGIKKSALCSWQCSPLTILHHWVPTEVPEGGKDVGVLL